MNKAVGTNKLYRHRPHKEQKLKHNANVRVTCFILN